MQFGVLGSLQIVDDFAPVELGGARLRRLLAVLLVHANEVVSEDRLVDLVWGQAGPSTGARALRVNVSRLRKQLEPRRVDTEHTLLVTRPPGYLLSVPAADLDATRFEQLLGDARLGLAEADPLVAVATLDEALALWRGPALAEFADEDWAKPVVARWDELRAVAFEMRAEGRLACGLHAEVVGDLTTLIDRQPLREQPRALLMLARRRCYTLPPEGIEGGLDGWLSG